MLSNETDTVETLDSLKEEEKVAFCEFFPRHSEFAEFQGRVELRVVRPVYTVHAGAVAQKKGELGFFATSVL